MDEQTESLNEVATAAIRNRAKRLLKLMECNAPSIIIFNEAAILFSHAQMLGDGKYYAEKMAKDAKKEFLNRKNRYEFCAWDGCQNQCFEEMEYEGLLFCCSCHEMLIKQRAADELEMENFIRRQEGGQ
jgi:hypothetical protein